jgi:uncharacterized Zn finger protein
MSKQQQTTIEQLQALTPINLERWAGRDIVSRGQSYQRSGYVHNLICTPQGKLTAQVRGSIGIYTTQVTLIAKGVLTSKCTCPYDDTCKHAVAVVLEYLEQAKHHSKASPAFSISAYLHSQTKEQLVALLEELVESHPSVTKVLQDRCTLTGAGPKEIIASIKKELTHIDQQLEWDAGVANVTHLKQRLENLLAMGYVDEAVGIGAELLSVGNRCMEARSEEEDQHFDIADCLTLLFQALPRSSLSLVEQMLWVVDMELDDQYDLCEGANTFWQGSFSTEDWSTAADALLKRLTPQSSQSMENYSIAYRFDRLISYATKMLRQAGREAEIIPLYQQQWLGKTSSSYLHFVELLKEAGRIEEALQWIPKGIAATEKTAAGIAGQLRNIFREIQEKSNNWVQVTALIAEDFFNWPSLETFMKLQDSAKRTNAWPAIRTAALYYLETGNLPVDSKTWPLPPAVLKMAPRDSVSGKFPDMVTLIKLAIAEKRPNDVMYWYTRITVAPNRWLSKTLAEQVAKAVIATHPDEAIAILKKIAEQLIASTTVPAYHEAATYLQPIRSSLLELGRQEEWRNYVQQLRQKNSRKYKLLAVLDTLEEPV